MFSIANTKRTALGTGLGSVGRIDQENLNSAHLGLVGDELSQLKERPAVKDFSKPFSVPRGLPDVGEIFKRDGRTALIGKRHNLFGNPVVHILLKPFLGAGGLSKMPPGVASAFALKSLSQSMIAISNRLDSFASELCSITAYCNFLYSKIDTENIAVRFDRLIGNFYHKIKKVFPAPFYDFTVAELGCFGKHPLLVFTKNKRYSLPSVSGGDRGRLNSIKAERAVVAERKNRLFECMLLLFLRSVRVAHFVFNITANLRRKMKSGLDSIIDKMMERHAVEAFFLPGYLGDVVHRLKAFGQGLVQDFDLSLRRIQFAFDSYLHDTTSISYRTALVKVYFEKGEGQFLRQLKQAVSLPCFL